MRAVYNRGVIPRRTAQCGVSRLPRQHLPGMRMPRRVFRHRGLHQVSQFQLQSMLMPCGILSTNRGVPSWHHTVQPRLHADVHTMSHGGRVRTRLLFSLRTVCRNGEGSECLHNMHSQGVRCRILQRGVQRGHATDLHTLHSMPSKSVLDRIQSDQRRGVSTMSHLL